MVTCEPPLMIANTDAGSARPVCPAHNRAASIAPMAPTVNGNGLDADAAEYLGLIGARRRTQQSDRRWDHRAGHIRLRTVVGQRIQRIDHDDQPASTTVAASVNTSRHHWMNASSSPSVGAPSSRPINGCNCSTNRTTTSLT